MPDLPGRLTPITEALRQVFRLGRIDPEDVGPERLATILDAVIVKSIAAELRALAPAFCRWCAIGQPREVHLHMSVTAQIYTHRETEGEAAGERPMTWPCAAAALWFRAHDLDPEALMGSTPLTGEDVARISTDGP